MLKNNILTIKGKELRLPVFFPDATRGVIRSLDTIDLYNADINGLIVNTYHLLSQPGTQALADLGGIKKLMNWDKWIISDSGGFQMFSLIHRNNAGHITKDGVTFNLSTNGGIQKYKITPQKCIQIQFDIGSDIMIVLDYFTPFNATYEEAQKSVDTTIRWAKLCKEEFAKICQDRGLNQTNRPLLFAVIQGAHYKDLRKKCADELQSIGFDGYGLGGWTMDTDGQDLDNEIIEYTANLIANDKPKYALGIGSPQGLVDAVKFGWNIFDCVLPTRDARHKRLYNFTRSPDCIDDIFTATDWYSYLYINRQKYLTDDAPISQFCDCFTCKNYSRSYLRHLFIIGDSLAFRLCTIHNLRFYSKLIDILQNAKSKD